MSPLTLSPRQRLLALALMLASGFAALGYQIVWTQQFTLGLGHEAAAVLAVVAAFFGGLAFGALLLGGRIERSARPGRWYAGCEALIGLWSLALALLVAPASGMLLDLSGAHPAPAWQWAVAFCGSFVLLLPATAAMGATLPALERALADLRHGGRSIAWLYAGNTFGAMFGVLGAAFWLVPTLGLVRTAALCAVLNGACALLALRLFAAAPAQAATVAAAGAAPRRLRTLLLVTGLLGIGYEVLVVRVLSQVAENTVYTFALLLAVYLVGSALGAAAYERHAAQRGAADPTRDRLRDRLLALLAAACLAGTGALWAAAWLKAALLDTLGGGMAAALVAEAVLALVSFGPPTLVMGALFSHLATQALQAGIGFGRALGINTLGAAAAPLVFGVLGVPLLGAKQALLLVAVAYLLLLPWRAWRNAWPAAVLATAAGVAVWAPPLAFVEVPEGGRVLSYQEGAMAAVSVVEDADGVARLRINNRQQEGSSATRLADARQALLPLLLHPQPQHALFLGVGTGTTASAAADESTLEVDAVDLLPEVIEASRLFTRLRDEAPNPRLHLHVADARRFMRSGDRRYDLIVADNFHPARSGSGALYTVEHFQAVRARLATGGVFVQWLPLHQLDLATLRSIVRSFVAASPQSWAMLATNSLDTPVVGLVARADGERFDLAALRARLAQTSLPRAPAEFGLGDELALLGSFIAGPEALRRFAGDAPLNTDDRPIVSYMAPRITYAPDSLPRERLIELLGAVSLSPAELVNAAPEWSPRLAAYWRARDRFIAVGRHVQPRADVRQMLAQVREPLLQVLALSPDFRPAYDPLLGMAVALGRSDPVGARELLAQLQRQQPARPEAARLLAELGGP